MIYVNWSNLVNKNFFSMSSKPKENTEITEFLSGRSASWKRNSKDIMTYTLKLRLEVGDELNAFWYWFNNQLGQTANAFICDAIGPKLYRFVSIPEPQDTDTNYRTLELEIEEVY